MNNLDNTRNIVDRFWKYIEFDQLYKIIGVIMEVDPIARSTVDVLNMDKPLEQHSIGVLRTNLITDRLKYIHSLDNGIDVSLESNAFGNPSAKVLVNNKVWITVKKHDNPYTLPEEAIFRKELARSNPHATPLLDLINFRIDDSDKSKNNYINCIITYKLPNHISVIFPCKRYKHLLAEPIDVLTIYQDYERGDHFRKQSGNLKCTDISADSIEKKPLKLRQIQEQDQ